MISLDKPLKPEWLKINQLNMFNLKFLINPFMILMMILKIKILMILIPQKEPKTKDKINKIII